MLLKIAEVNDKKFHFFCEAKQTQSGFFHRVSMFRNTNFCVTETVIYLNRTWEKYAFQSAIKNVLQSAFTKTFINQDEYDNLYEQVEKGI